MNYELAKQLKDAGFPQNGTGQFIDVKLASPTLSELIEACGDDFLNLYKTKDKWNCVHPLEDNDDCCGSTPEEAVAHLWLELNK